MSMPDVIESTSNPRVKWARSLLQTDVRRLRQEYLVEGVRLAEEALDAGVRPRMVLIAPNLLERTPRGQALLRRVAEAAVLVTERVLASATDTVSPQGILMVLPIPEPASITGFTLILDGIQDPGNAGTILRTADACGLVKTVVAIGCVDLYAPKVVRAAMGAHFRLSIARVAWSDLADACGSGCRFVLADVMAGQTVWDVDWLKADGLIVGGEAEGPGSEARALARETAVIPMRGPTDSLNVAVAASIILFEAAHRRGLLSEGIGSTNQTDARVSLTSEDQ
jgi:RNA methyltransferase, TrmH family